MKLKILSISFLLLASILFGQQKRWTEMTDKEQWNILQDTIKLYDEVNDKYEKLKISYNEVVSDNEKLTVKSKKYNKYKITTQAMILVNSNIQIYTPLGIGFEYRPFRYFSFGNMLHYDPIGNAGGGSIFFSVIF